MQTYHRFTNSQNPDNGVGYMMCAANGLKCEGYGKFWHKFTGETVSVDEVIAAAIEEGFEQELGYSADLLSPSDIVNSAEAWDDTEAVNFMWERVCEPRGWMAVEAGDGCIVFDPALFETRTNEDFFEWMETLH